VFSTGLCRIIAAFRPHLREIRSLFSAAILDKIEMKKSYLSTSTVVIKEYILKDPEVTKSCISIYYDAANVQCTSIF